jgi:hypothetical protein
MKKLILLIVTLLTLGGTFAPAANALSLTISVGDQPYYVHGPGYWAGNVYYVWVPGHYNRNGHWVHGHYRVR